MADKKISALTAASTPLAGTEVLPIVQTGSTVKVATDDLTVKNVRSNATTGILQIAGPGTGTTRTMTTPNANFTAARTDAAQSFTGDQTLSSGDLIFGTNAKGVKDASGVKIVNGATTTVGNVTLTSNQQFASPTGALYDLGKAFAVQTFKTNGNQTSITLTFTRQSGMLYFGATWSGSAGSTLGGAYYVLCNDSGVAAVMVAQNNLGGFGNATITTSGFDLTITMPGGATALITGCFVGTAVA